MGYRLQVRKALLALLYRYPSMGGAPGPASPVAPPTVSCDRSWGPPVSLGPPPASLYPPLSPACPQ